MKNIIFFLLLLSSTLLAQEPIGPFVNYNFDAEVNTVTMTFSTPAGVSSLDIGSFTERYQDQYTTLMGTCTRSVLVSDDVDDVGIPLWYAYVLKDWKNQFTYEVHMYGMVTFCGADYYLLQRIPYPTSLVDLTNWIGF